MDPWALRSLVAQYVDGRLDLVAFEDALAPFAARLAAEPSRSYVAELSGLIEILLAEMSNGDRLEIDVRDLMRAELDVSPTLQMQFGAPPVAYEAEANIERRLLPRSSLPPTMPNRSPQAETSARTQTVQARDRAAAASAADTQLVEAAA